MEEKYKFDFFPTGKDCKDFVNKELGISDEEADELDEEALDEILKQCIFKFQMEAIAGMNQIEVHPGERLVCGKFTLENDEPGELLKTITFRPGNLDQIFRVFETLNPDDKVSYHLFINENDDLVANLLHTEYPNESYVFRISPETECFADAFTGDFNSDHRVDYFSIAQPAGKRIYEYLDDLSEFDLGPKIRELGRNAMEVEEYEEIDE